MRSFATGSSAAGISKKNVRRLAVLGGVAAACSAGAGGSAYGSFTITPTFDSSITSDSNALAIEGVINQSIAKYQSLFSNNVNVKITYEEQTTGLGENSSAVYEVSYASFRAALAANASSTDDTTALAHLANTTANPVNGTTDIIAKSANLRALGYGSGYTPTVDGTILLNTHLTDIGSSDSSHTYSLLSVVEHETNELLGLGSDIGGTGAFANPGVQDLYRYAANGTRSYTTDTSAKAYFSIDGTTDLAQYDNQGDGGDYGDWQSNPLPSGVAPKVQDAFATPGASPSLGVEIRALDVIGYTVVPEPASALLLSAGLGMGLCRRTRRVVAK